MTAYDVLRDSDTSQDLTEQAFYELIKKFRASFLKVENYTERLQLHRNPIVVHNEVLRTLYDLIIKIQNRDEMRHVDLVKSYSGYVPSEIRWIWESDKRLKSLYNATTRYCFLHGKDFKIISVHIAEYRAVNSLVTKIRQSISKLEKQSEPISKEQPEKKNKRTTIPYKTKVILLNEVNHQCPFCFYHEPEHLEVHHIDEDPTHKDLARLIMVCSNCHTKISNGFITRNEVEEIKLKTSTTKTIPVSGQAKTNVKAKVVNITANDKGSVIIKQANKKVIQKYPPGCIGFEAEKANYISYLIKRYHEYKEWEVGKEKMNYSILNKNLKRHFKLGNQRTIFNLPIEKFEDLIQSIQSYVDKTKLAVTKGKGHRNYSTFSEYQSQKEIN